MFKRFSPDYEVLFRSARDSSITIGDSRIRSEHVLVAMTLSDDLGPVLDSCGCATGVAEQLVASLAADRLGNGDATSLRSLGIDLDEVRSEIDAQFGPGALDRARSARLQRGNSIARWCRRHLPRRATADGHAIVASNFHPFAGEAKANLELALRVSLSRKAKTVALPDLVIAMFDETHNQLFVAASRRAGIDVDGLRSHVMSTANSDVH